MFFNELYLTVVQQVNYQNIKNLFKNFHGLVSCS